MATTVTETLTIRKIDLSDAESVAELSRQLGYEATTEEISERIGWLHRYGASQIALVACVNTQVVGWIEAAVEHHLQSPPFSLITGLVVREGTRGLGVGKRLCEAIEQWSREKGLSIIRVTSRSTRQRAHQFYLRDGFRQTKTSAVFEKILS